jgi:hypothetical protein
MISVLLGIDARDALLVDDETSQVVSEKYASALCCVRVLSVTQVALAVGGPPDKLVLLQSLIGAEGVSGTEVLRLACAPGAELSEKLLTQMKDEMGIRDASDVASGDVQVFVSDDRFHRELIKCTGQGHRMMSYAEFKKWSRLWNIEEITQMTTPSGRCGSLGSATSASETPEANSSLAGPLIGKNQRDGSRSATSDGPRSPLRELADVMERNAMIIRYARQKKLSCAPTEHGGKNTSHKD